MIDTTRRTHIQWTDTAREALRGLPKDAARGLVAKADKLLEVEDPREAAKALVGPLQGYFRIRHGRYRAVFSVTERTLKNGDVAIEVTVTFVTAGKRQSRSRKDVYQVATRLIQYLDTSH